MAGPAAMLAVPRATFLSTILPAATSGLRSAATPMSTTTTRAPASRRQGVDARHAGREAVDHLPA